MVSNSPEVPFTARTVATRESWTNVALPEKRTILSFPREFSEAEYELIRFGVIPEAMENKWFIFLEEGKLYFHRSWTGFCIYQLTLSKHDEGYKVIEAFANRDPSQYSPSTNDGYDEDLLNFLIDNLLLGKTSTFPVPNDVPPGIATGLYHHHVAGVGPSEDAVKTPTIRSALSWLWSWLKFLIKGLGR